MYFNNDYRMSQPMYYGHDGNLNALGYYTARANEQIDRQQFRNDVTVGTAAGQILAGLIVGIVRAFRGR